MRGLNATVLGIIGLIALALFYDFGTLSPCGILRETVRKRDGLAAILPDSIVDLGLAAQYGELSPSRCVAILMNDLKPVTTAQATLPPSPAPRSPAPQAKVTAQDPVQWAMQVTVKAENECRAKRVRGELPSYAASAECSNPTMLAAFKEARYRYMDLIQFFAAKRLELAKQIDIGQLTEQQAQAETTQVYQAMIATERQRDQLARNGR